MSSTPQNTVPPVSSSESRHVDGESVVRLEQQQVQNPMDQASRVTAPTLSSATRARILCRGAASAPTGLDRAGEAARTARHTAGPAPPSRPVVPARSVLQIQPLASVRPTRSVGTTRARPEPPAQPTRTTRPAAIHSARTIQSWGPGRPVAQPAAVGLERIASIQSQTRSRHARPVVKQAEPPNSSLERFEVIDVRRSSSIGVEFSPQLTAHSPVMTPTPQRAILGRYVQQPVHRSDQPDYIRPCCRRSESQLDRPHFMPGQPDSQLAHSGHHLQSESFKTRPAEPSASVSSIRLSSYLSDPSSVVQQTVPLPPLELDLPQIIDRPPQVQNVVRPKKTYPYPPDLGIRTREAVGMLSAMTLGDVDVTGQIGVQIHKPTPALTSGLESDQRSTAPAHLREAENAATDSAVSGKQKSMTTGESRAQGSGNPASQTSPPPFMAVQIFAPSDRTVATLQPPAKPAVEQPLKRPVHPPPGVLAAIAASSLHGNNTPAPSDPGSTSTGTTASSGIRAPLPPFGFFPCQPPSPTAECEHSLFRFLSTTADLTLPENSWIEDYQQLIRLSLVTRGNAGPDYMIQATFALAKMFRNVVIKIQEGRTFYPEFLNSLIEATAYYLAHAKDAMKAELEKQRIVVAAERFADAP